MCILIDCMLWSPWFIGVPWGNTIESGSCNNTPLPYAFSIQIMALSPLLAENECVEAPWQLSQCLLCSFSCSPWKATTTRADKGQRENVLQNKVTMQQYNSWERKDVLLWEGKSFVGCLRLGCMVRKGIPGFLTHSRDSAEESREQKNLTVGGFILSAPWCEKLSFRATGGCPL